MLASALRKNTIVCSIDNNALLVVSRYRPLWATSYDENDNFAVVSGNKTAKDSEPVRCFSSAVPSAAWGFHGECDVARFKFAPRTAKTASMWAHRFCFPGCRLHPAVDAKQFGDAVRRLEPGAGQHHHGRLIHAYGALAQ